jgi:hypothetical protein
VVAVVLALAACGDPPPLKIKYKLSGSGQQCMNGSVAAQSCSDVALPCAAHLGVRIIPPGDPTRAFVSICEPIIGRPDLCSIAGINLPDGVTIPEQTLEVEVAVYPDNEFGGDCPTDSKFAPDGLPVSDTGAPAVGGAAYYHPGDSETTILLGCTDQAALAACQMDDSIIVNATVNDFDAVSLSKMAADQLELFVGEPHASPEQPNEYILNPTATKALDRTAPQPPAWGTTLTMADQTALMLIDSICVEVLDFSTVIRPILVCKPYTQADKTISLTGVRIAGPTLDQILAADALADIPQGGIVIGMVVDSNFMPVAGVSVAPSSGYLSEDRTRFLAPGGASTTTSNGIFIANAPYGTMFTAHGATMLQVASGFGGVVDGKVTVVMLQFPNPQGN